MERGEPQLGPDESMIGPDKEAIRRIVEESGRIDYAGADDESEPVRRLHDNLSALIKAVKAGSQAVTLLVDGAGAHHPGMDQILIDYRYHEKANDLIVRDSRNPEARVRYDEHVIQNGGGKKHARFTRSEVIDGREQHRRAEPGEVLDLIRMIAGAEVAVRRTVVIEENPR